MKGLHISTEGFLVVGMITCVPGGGDDLFITHLFYANDAIFLGEWLKENISYIVRLVNCFYFGFSLQSDIKKKYCLYGVGVEESEV